MKKFTLLVFAGLFTAHSFAQDTRLNDSVIFIKDKPVALYSKTLSKSLPRYNMEVYSFDDYVLIKAEAIKFNAPVAELRPFYYYELTFPQTADTFAVYIEDEAFPLVLARIISDYRLIEKNTINKKNLNRFMADYPGGPALTAKIKSFMDYLDETRYFSEQVKRDRTKPVYIINDKVIMQDGVKIGLIAAYQQSTVGRPYLYYNPQEVIVNNSTQSGTREIIIPQEEIINTGEIHILLDNGRRIDNNKYYKNWSPEETNKRSASAKTITERSLYQVSKAANKRIGAKTDDLLMRVCYLIEDFSL